MATVASFFLPLACLFAYPAAVDGFAPTLILGLAGATLNTHQKMTEMAIRKIAVDIMSANPELYPDQKATWKEATDVIEEFQKAVAYPDFEESDIPEAHFDSETFVGASNRMIMLRETVIGRIQAKDMAVARLHAGLALHTLQDFYSHSNWIEMGNRRAYPELGEKRIEASKLAGANETTCINCDVATEPTCVNNIVPEINEQELLTSGYYKSLKKLLSSNLKPSGKCSHGGVLDASSYRDPSGGINKDTYQPLLSPHAYLHLEAAEAALESTINFFESIRLAVKTDDGLFEDERFAEFIGIPVGWSLCFIVDTTGSMSDEIAAVRDISIAITEATSSSTGRQKPSNFVLSPFNDPEYGPLFTTNSADEMIAQLSALTADGGDDEPELAFHGIIAALNAVRDGSTCNFFTDASAKDSELYPEALSLALTKNVRITQFLTNVGPLPVRRKRSARRQKRSTTYPYYSDLSRLTGGSVLEISKADISQAVGVVDSDSGYSQMTVFTADNIYNGFAFYSDISITKLKIQLIDSSSSLESAILTSPSGVSFDNLTEVIGLSSVKIYNLTEPEPGLWRVNVSNSNQPFTAIVTASTPIDFTYTIGVLSEAGHGGYFAISGNPIAGEEYYIVVKVLGAFDAFDDNSTNILSNITFILLVSQTGEIVTRLPALELDPLKEYTAKTTLPTSGFRVAIEGEDTDGNVVQRYDKSVVSAVVIQLEISIEGSGSLSLFPHSSLNVSVTVTSVGELATWYIRVSDTGNFYTGETPIGVTLGRNESSVIYLGFKVPSNVTYGFVSTVTVSASASSTSSVENYKVFYINVKSAPLCAVDRVEGVCNGTRPPTPDCVNTTWSVHFHVRDSASGLKSVSPAGASLTDSSYTFQVDNFTEGSNSTINGVYSSSCCHPEVTIIATDVFGNIGRCFVSNDPISPLCTVLNLQGSCRSNYAVDQMPTCESETWQGSFLASDAGSGLALIEAITSSTDYTLEPSDVSYGTVDVVNGTYNSSCCQQTATIRLTDVAGNTGECTLVARTTSNHGGGNSGRNIKSRPTISNIIRKILKKHPKYKGGRFTKTGRRGSRLKKPGLVVVW